MLSLHAAKLCRAVLSIALTIRSLSEHSMHVCGCCNYVDCYFYELYNHLPDNDKFTLSLHNRRMAVDSLFLSSTDVHVAHYT